MERNSSKTIRWLGACVAALVVSVLASAPLSANDTGRADTASAPQTSPDLDVKLEQTLIAPEQPRAGDPIDLKLRVEHPAESEVRVEPELEESRWSLLEKRSRTSGNERRSTSIVTLTFQVFRTGSATLEPIDLVVSTPDGRSADLQTDPVSLNIQSVLAKSDDSDFRAAPDPYPVWTRDYTLGWVGGGVAAALAVGLLALGVFRREDEQRPKPKPSIPPEEEALERLETLRNSELLERGEFMVYYVRLSATVRRYLGRRFGFPGTEWTTAEILARLEGVVWEGDIELEEIADWMHRVDRVKFSGLVPPVDEAERTLERAFEIVRQTEPPASDDSEEEDDGDGPDGERASS